MRVMASGLAHPQWNNGDVHAADADVEGARAFYAALGVPWGVRVPTDIPGAHGRCLFRKRLMGVYAAHFLPARQVRGLTIGRSLDLETIVRIDAVAFASEPVHEWAQGHLGRPGVETALAWLDGAPVATAYSLLSD